MKNHRVTDRDSVKHSKRKRKTYSPGNTALPSTNISFMQSEEESVLRLNARRSATASGLLLLLTLSLMIFENEKQYALVSFFYLNMLRTLIILLNMIQMSLIYKYYTTKLEEKKARMEVCLYSKLCDDPDLLKKFALESGLCLLFVPPYVSFDIVMPDLSKLSVNDLIVMLSLSKSYLWVKLLYEFSSRNTERTKFYSKRFNLGKGWRFVLKSYVTDSPGFSILALSLLMFFVLGFVMRISERPSLSIWDSFWLIGVTGTSLGYGDFVPQSLLGRSVSFLSAVFGMFLHSFSLMFLRKHLEMTIQQEKFYDKVKFAKKDLKAEAILFIQAWWKYIRKSTRNEPRLGDLRRFASNFRKFSKKRMSALLEKQKNLKSQLIETSASVAKAFELSHSKLSNTQKLLSKSHAIVRDSHSAIEKIKRIRDFNAQASPRQFTTSRKDLDNFSTQRHSSGRVGMKIKRDIALVKHVSKHSYNSKDVSSQYFSDVSLNNTNPKHVSKHSYNSKDVSSQYFSDISLNNTNPRTVGDHFSGLSNGSLNISLIR